MKIAKFIVWVFLSVGCLATSFADVPVEDAYGVPHAALHTEDAPLALPHMLPSQTVVHQQNSSEDSFATRLSALEAHQTEVEPAQTQALQALHVQLQTLTSRMDAMAYELHALKVQDTTRQALQKKTSTQDQHALEARVVTQSQAVLDEQDAYNKAYRVLQAKQYSDAIAGMQAYLRRYPKGHYAANAQYWLGELYLLSGQEVLAVQALNEVVTHFPDHPKAPDALLKLGYFYDESGQIGEARKHLKQLIQQFPDSSAARLATERLRHIEMTYSTQHAQA